MKKISEKITEKHMYMAIQIIFWLSLIPILWLALYNYPCADDFTASDSVREAWLTTGSLWRAFVAVMENVKHNYLNWSGVFMSVFWTTLQPSVFGERYYGVVTFITIALLVLGGWYLGKVVFRDYLKVKKDTANSIILLYLFMTIQYMPDGNEGLYWHAGVVNYTWAFAFLLILTGLELSLWKEQKRKKRVIKVVLACIMAVCVGGGNYITALQGCIWLFVINVVFLLQVVVVKKQKMNKERILELIPLLVVCAAFGTSVLAPGNAVRIAGSTGFGPIKAVLVSFLYCLEVPFTMWLKWTFYATVALVIPFMWKALNSIEFEFSYPGIVAILGYGIVSASFTPSLYAQASVDAGRLHDTAYFVFVFVVFVVLFYTLGWLRKNVFISTDTIESKLSGTRCSYILWLSIFILFGCIIDGKANGNVNITASAMTSLISGQAEQYRVENEERLEMLYNSEVKNVVFKSFSNPPELLLFEDITPNPGEWINDTMAVYYGKESVKRE